MSLTIKSYGLDAIAFLEESCHIEKKYVNMQKRKQVSKGKKYKAMTIALNAMLAILVIASIAALVIGITLPPPKVVEKEKMFYEPVTDFIAYDIFGQTRPEPEIIDPYIQYRNLPLFASISFAVCCLSWFGYKIYSVCKTKKFRLISQQWEDFQVIKREFSAVSDILLEQGA